MPANLDSLVVVARNNRYLGKISVPTILTSDPSATVSTLMRRIEAIPINMPVAEVATIFEQRNILSASVVDEQGYLA
jgi:magnesium transporter